jgi:hypothetical protein
MMRKIIVASALVLFVFTLSFKVFLDWDASNHFKHDLMLNGYHVEATATTYKPSQNLVPKNTLLTVGDVDEIKYTYTLLVLPERSLDSKFQTLVLKTADGEVTDKHDLFNIKSEVLSNQNLKNKDYDRVVMESTLTLSKPETRDQIEFLHNVLSMSFNIALNVDN